LSRGFGNRNARKPIKASKAGILKLFPIMYPHAIEQLTGTLRLASRAVGITLLHHNNATSGKIDTEFSIGTHLFSSSIGY